MKQINDINLGALASGLGDLLSTDLGGNFGVTVQKMERTEPLNSLRDKLLLGFVVKDESWFERHDSTATAGAYPPSLDDDNTADELITADSTISELTQHAKKIDETNWGPWKLDRTTREIYMDKSPKETYSFHIDQLQHDEPFLESLSRLEEKNWVDNECLGGLVRASFAVAAAFDDPIHKSK